MTKGVNSILRFIQHVNAEEKRLENAVLQAIKTEIETMRDARFIDVRDLLIH
ncbi:MAG: hypothetical protein M1412_08685 [Deltaproteobacteria bacterium]|nr:hypothetical protein [Deltaproteobacteria bacterium]MCL5893219.1 hypothetical protein [Deltaproteobacteria bacterium]